MRTHVLAAAAMAGVSLLCSTAAQPQTKSEPLTLGTLEYWDDGLSEMSYYVATDNIYGEERKYTRVHLINRQWNGLLTGVKCNPDDPDAIAVLKFNIAESIPTENYNYRYLTTLFLNRETLAPVKAASSSQEWCGTTFKHLRWTDAGLTYRCFSYFPDEGDHTWELPGGAVPFEAVFLLAREVGATGREMKLRLLSTLHTNRGTKPEMTEARLKVGDNERVHVPAGTFNARQVVLEGPDDPGTFWIEIAKPHRLIKYDAPPLSGALMHVERRAYWERSSRSTFYKPGEAP